MGIKIGDQVRLKWSGRCGELVDINADQATVFWHQIDTRSIVPLHAVERVHPPNDADSDPSAPLCILARAAEECLQYHVALEARDSDPVDGTTSLLSVGDLRTLVRQGRAEGVI